MRKLLVIFLLLCNTAWADITQQHFTFNQVFDVQWSISGGTLYTSGFNYIYASINSSGQNSAARLTQSQTNTYANAGDYMAFFASTTNPGYYGLGVYSPSGTLVRILDNYGTFTALANGAVFYNGAGSWGTLLTSTGGYVNGNSANFTVTTQNPTNTQVNAYSFTAGSTIANQNVAGAGAAYVFLYKGNMTTAQWTSTLAITNGYNWTCSTCSITSGVVSYSVLADATNGYFDVYLKDSSGNAVTPNTGQVYTFTPPNAAPTVVSTVNSTITTTTTSGSTVYTYRQPITTTTWSDGTQTVANNGSATLLSTTTTGGSGGITTNEQSAVTSVHTRQSTMPSTSFVYVDQIGSNDHIAITQNNQFNSIGGETQSAMKIRGGNNTVSIHQGDPTNTTSTHNIIATDLLGGSNSLTINQGTDGNGNGSGSDSGYHYAGVYVNGVNNSVNIQQQATTGTSTGNYASINITGNQNNAAVVQTGAAPKQLFTTVTGNQNTVNTSQTGLGQHFLDINLSGDGNSATVNQSGSAANAATINLINAGGPASVNLTQTGGQSYGITQSCVQSGGCGTVTVRQGP